jgi:hypothetical protein
MVGQASHKITPAINFINSEAGNENPGKTYADFV